MAWFAMGYSCFYFNEGHFIHIKKKKKKKV